MMLTQSRILESRINGGRDARDEFKRKYGRNWVCSRSKADGNEFLDF
jgi:hypothetical protein